MAARRQSKSASARRFFRKFLPKSLFRLRDFGRMDESVQCMAGGPPGLRFNL